MRSGPRRTNKILYRKPYDRPTPSHRDVRACWVFAGEAFKTTSQQAGKLSKGRSALGWVLRPALDESEVEHKAAARLCVLLHVVHMRRTEGAGGHRMHLKQSGGLGGAGEGYATLGLLDTAFDRLERRTLRWPWPSNTTLPSELAFLTG